MDLAPILLFTFNRLDHTKKTISALKQNELAKESELFIFSDGPKSIGDTVIVENLREYLDTVEGFKKVKIIKSQNNNGLANSIINGVNTIINSYKKVIVLEDDLITSKYFLLFMNNALNIYKDRNDIWSISGYGPNIDIPMNYTDEIYITMRGSSWGWATWKERWDLVDWKVEDYEMFKKNKSMISKFNLCGKDLSFMLEDQMKRRIDSWAIRWVYSQFKNNKYTIYPIKSLVKNIGNDLSGTHTNTTNHFDVELYNNPIKLAEDIRINRNITDSFRRFYDYNFSGYFVLLIKHIGLYKQIRRIRNKFVKKILLS